MVTIAQGVSVSLIRLFHIHQEQLSAFTSKIIALDGGIRRAEAGEFPVTGLIWVCWTGCGQAGLIGSTTACPEGCGAAFRA